LKLAVTDNGAANFAPYFFPDGKRIIFSSNAGDPRRRDFELYVIEADGSGLTRITFSPDFDGFPMFNRAGTRLLFASNRNGKKPRETNIFVADWVGSARRALAFSYQLSAISLWGLFARASAESCEL